MLQPLRRTKKGHSYGYIVRDIKLVLFVHTHMGCRERYGYAASGVHFFGGPACEWVTVPLGYEPDLELVADGNSVGRSRHRRRRAGQSGRCTHSATPKPATTDHIRHETGNVLPEIDLLMPDLHIVVPRCIFT